MMTLENRLYEAALEQPCINTHCHINTAAPVPRTLPELLKKSYLNWQFKRWISPEMEIEVFLDQVSCNSYFYVLAKALGELYTKDKAPLGLHNWHEIEQGLAEAANQSGRAKQLLEEKCHYQAVILDLQHNPGYDNAAPSLFRPAFRCDMFLRGHPQAGRDENGNDPRSYLPRKGDMNLQEYLESMGQAVKQKAAQGAVALKLAIAYERGLDFDIVDFDAAQRGWTRADATPYEVKAFEDTVAFYLCRIAGDLKLPVQVHTGMGQLVHTNALWLKPLLDYCPQTQFVLLHCSYPHTADCMALLHEYNNVYADLSWLPLLSPDAAGVILGELLDIADCGRIAWGCDAETPEESIGAHQVFCQILSRVLSRKAEYGYYSQSTCEQLLSQILLKAPRTLYGLQQ